MLILMGLFNGARHLEAQLASLRDCGLGAWELRVSDDGSSDDGLRILQTFAQQLEGGACRVHCSYGPGRGFAANYMQLLADLPEVTGCVALADQDDIWLPDRLARATALLNRIPPGVPAFTCARRLDWRPETGKVVATRPLRKRPSFANALLENVAFGNTIVMNAAAARLARAAAPRAGGIYAHDWFLYQLLTGAGALCLQEEEPAVLYRQHAGNAIGAQTGALAWLRRKLQVLQGLYALRVSAQVQALIRCEDMLLPENRATLVAFLRAREAPLFGRLRRLRQAGVFRQRFGGILGFWGAAVLGRV